VQTVLFVCVQNAGRSQMAAALFNRLADPDRAIALSAGTRPALSVHPAVVAVMNDAGIDLSGVRPRPLTADLIRDATLVVTMGCGDECPNVPGVARDDWPLADPQGRPLEDVARIRDEIRRRVSRLLTARGWGRLPERAERP
jgi:arsenate reductase